MPPPVSSVSMIISLIIVVPIIISMLSTHFFFRQYYNSIIVQFAITSDTLLQNVSQNPQVQRIVNYTNTYLESCGVPKDSLWNAQEWVLATLTIVTTLLTYYLLMGKRHDRKRKLLAEDLRIAQAQVNYLEEKLMLVLSERERLTNSHSHNRNQVSRPIRIFMDGAFDLMHYGHMNAFRLAKSLGTHLVVGVNSDETITACKGPPLMNDIERLTMVQGCKFVDEVVPGCPYVMNEAYVNYVIQTYKIDYVVHGDDPCIVDGKDVYEAAKKAGKYQSIPRTEGVSTTDIVGRMLIMTKDHHHASSSTLSTNATTVQRDDSTWLCAKSKFLTTR